MGLLGTSEQLLNNMHKHIRIISFALFTSVVLWPNFLSPFEGTWYVWEKETSFLTKYLAMQYLSENGHFTAKNLDSS